MQTTADNVPLTLALWPSLCLVRALPAQKGKEQAYKRIGDNKIGFLHDISAKGFTPNSEHVYVVALISNKADRSTWIGVLCGQLVQVERKIA